MRKDVSTAKNEKIELTLPVNAAYVSAARLTASSISNRMGFNIEDIEDIKIAVSEACIFLIEQCTQIGQENFHIEFMLNENSLGVRLDAEINADFSQKYDNDDLGIKMIQALMNKLDISIVKNNIVIDMLKNK